MIDVRYGLKYTSGIIVEYNMTFFNEMLYLL